MSLLHLCLFLLIISPVLFIFSKIFSFLIVVIVLLSVVLLSYVVGVYIRYKKHKKNQENM